MKWFVFSDIHSFCTELLEALDKKGFDINNPEHGIVLCGDAFDRGHETLETYRFLLSLPKDRRIFVRGNHELLYLELLNKNFPDSYDFSNGTVRTFCSIAKFDEKCLDANYWYILNTDSFEDNVKAWDRALEQVYDYWNQIKECVKEHPITKWLKSDEWLNYWETDNYIFVHSFIPVLTPITYKWGEPRVIGDKQYREDWRNATDTEWADATWGCPWKLAQLKLNKTGKTIICGHWHTSDFFNNLTKIHKDTYDCPIFTSKRYKLIGLDACTVRSGKVNVFMFED